MKKENSHSEPTSKPAKAKHRPEGEGAKLVDEAPHGEDVDAAKPIEGNRPVNVDAVHRFGKNPGSK